MMPKDLLDKLKKGTSLKVQDTLDAIYRICIEQQERGINDFSVATISKLGHSRGVPKAQSIRNKAGEQYRALITAFSESNHKKKPVRPVKSDEDWIEEISNPKHKLLVRILSSELRAAQKQLEEIIPPKLRVDVYDHKSSAPAAESKLTDQERRALEYIISNQFQKKWDLTANKYGELVDVNDKPVFKVATIDAIKKSLEYL
jgi:hypothetical protein